MMVKVGYTLPSIQQAVERGTLSEKRYKKKGGKQTKILFSGKGDVKYT
jgi:hypothetical protein